MNTVYRKLCSIQIVHLQKKNTNSNKAYPASVLAQTQNKPDLPTQIKRTAQSLDTQRKVVLHQYHWCIKETRHREPSEPS